MVKKLSIDRRQEQMYISKVFKESELTGEGNKICKLMVLDREKM